MRRIIIAIGSTLAGLVLLFSFPTSLNRIAAANAIGAAATTSSTTTEAAAATAATAATDAVTAQAAADAAAAKAAADATSAADAATASVTHDGAVASTRYGNVQVRITVTNGAVASAEAIAYPSGDRESKQINAYAVPVLNAEAAAAGSANIAMVSGATYTSNGYLQSLQSALDQAGL